jgi:hypothetical protein
LARLFPGEDTHVQTFRISGTQWVVLFCYFLLMFIIVI